MKIAAFCGTFDPVTYGHLDIIERASKLFDELVVFISPNSDKNNEFTEARRHMIPISGLRINALLPE